MKTMKTMFLILTAFLIISPLKAQTVERVSGFITEDIGSFPIFYTYHDTSVYFVTLKSGSFSDYNLLKYNGTDSPEIVATLNPDYDNDYYYFGMQPVMYDNHLFFSGENYRLSYYNWSDAPVQIADTGLLHPRHLHVWKDKLFFTAVTDEWGTEICMYDGVNVPGVWLDLAPGTTDSDPRYLCSLGDYLFFTALDTVWMYSEAEGLQKISQTGYTSPNELHVAGNALYILASDGKRYTFWKYTEGTEPVKVDDTTLGNTYDILNVFVYNDQLYFRATTINFFTGDLYKINDEGVVERIEVEGSDVDEYFGTQPTEFHIHNNTLVYSAFSDFSRQQIFMYKGSGNAFLFPVDAEPLTIQNPQDYFSLGGDLYFFALDFMEGYQLNRLIIHPQAVENITSCKTYTVADQTYDASGTYTYRVPAEAGPDSIITLHLTIIPNMIVEQRDSLLTALQQGAEYTWIDEDYLPVEGGNVNPFVAPASGEYAVIIDMDGCIDTSAFYTVVLWEEPKLIDPLSGGIDRPVFYQQGDDLYLITHNLMAQTEINIYSLDGRPVSNNLYYNTNTFVVPVGNVPAGLYIAIISSGSDRAVLKIPIR